MVTSLGQALAHDGFDLTRHAWSELAAGPQGWIQMANLVLTGAMVVAFAVGLRRSSSSRWAPRLVATYGAGLIAAGLLVADPAAGYPVGAPVPTVPSWHGIGHFVAGGIGFAALIAACFVLARTFTPLGRPPPGLVVAASPAIGFAAAFVGISSGSSHPAVILAFVAAVLAAWAWLAGVAVHQYRTVSQSS